MRVLVVPLAVFLLMPFSVQTQQSTRPAPRDSRAFATPHATPSQQIVFAQITDAHIFDEGWKETADQAYLLALNDRAALHWAIDEINRLYSSSKPEERLSFVVYTGDFGLQNVSFAAKASRSCTVVPFRPEPGLPAVPAEVAEQEVATEFNRLAVRTIYVVPGNNDLVDEQIDDLPRYECFVQELKEMLKTQPEPVTLESLTLDKAVNAGPIRLAGLNSASFKDHAKYNKECAGIAASRAGGCPLPQFQALHRLLESGDSSLPLVLFSHVPDLIDPYRKKPSWDIDQASREQWEKDACDARLLGIFTGHFHSAQRELYATNTGTARLALNRCVSNKTWVTPPLAIKVQTTTQGQARGLIVVTVRGSKPAQVTVEPHWYASLPPPIVEQKMDWKHFLIIICVILLAGALGGWMNYLVGRLKSDKEDRLVPEPSSGGKKRRSEDSPEGDELDTPGPDTGQQSSGPHWADLGRSVVLGIGASFLVPLFLNMISSTLVENTYTEKGGIDYQKVLVFLGFCLVAAISSTAFIKTISDRVLRLAAEADKKGSEAQKKAEEATEKASAAQLTLEPLLRSLMEPDQESVTLASTPVELSDDERRILRALANPEYRLRSIRGVAGEVGMEQAEAEKILKGLKEKSLADCSTLAVRGTTQKGFRWFISPEGRKALSAIQE